MVPPFTDYFANTPNPVDSFLSGIGSGQAIQANMVNARNVEEARQQLALRHEADVEAVKQKSILEQQMFEQKIIADQAAAEKAAAIEEEKKSLGRDGLSSEFYTKFCGELSPVLEWLFNNIALGDNTMSKYKGRDNYINI
jgi:hypothetical protein